MIRTYGRFKVTSVKKSGQKGTKRLLAKYGRLLRCVRYIEDRLTGERFKTVELITEISPWTPSGLDPELIVGVRLGLHEKELRANVKRAGGCWDPYDKVWLLKYKDLEPLGLGKRNFIVREEEAEYLVQ